MNGRRGLTLIEVLASAALLSLLAAACLPLLREAAAASPTDPPAFDLLDLAERAEVALADGEAGGAGTFAASGEDVALDWPDHPDRSPLRTRVLVAADAITDHAWVVFECDGLAISRCVVVVPSPAAEAAP